MVARQDDLSRQRRLSKSQCPTHGIALKICRTVEKQPSDEQIKAAVADGIIHDCYFPSLVVEADVYCPRGDCAFEQHVTYEHPYHGWLLNQDVPEDEYKWLHLIVLGLTSPCPERDKAFRKSMEDMFTGRLLSLRDETERLGVIQLDEEVPL